MAGLLFFLTVAIFTAAAVTLSASAPWSNEARRSGLHVAFGVLLAPFLLGLSSVVLLGLSIRLSDMWTIVTLMAFGAALFAVSFLIQAPAKLLERLKIEYQPGLTIGMVVAGLGAISIFVSGAQLALYANDALEYATVAQELYRTRSLGSYPLLDSSVTASGFYGPWTHPPLYPALLFVTNIITGSDAPSVYTKLISVWLGVGAALLLFALGRLTSTIAAGFAAFFFLTTPLFADSTTTALIDAMPVAGIMLVFTLCIGLKAGPIVRGLLIGAALGAALWTHSQAIMFFPFAVILSTAYHGVRNGKTAAIEVATSVVIAGLIIVRPYFSNLDNYGSLISDNPLVFAVQSLGWADYFASARGIDSTAAAIQYGIFKGWFAQNSFGGVFWFATVGGVVLFWKNKKLVLSVAQFGTLTVPQLAAPVSAFLLLLAYISACILTVAVGQDIMIKNDRYLLSMLPLASLLAGYAAHALFGPALAVVTNGLVPSWKREVTAIALAAVSVYVVAPALMSQVRTSMQARDIFNGERWDYQLRSYSNTALMIWSKDHLASDAKVLSMRPADMIYSGQRMLSYLDPALLPFYAAATPQEALNMLRSLNVTHVQLPDYYIPPVYRSHLQQLLSDPSMAALRADFQGNQIYELVPDTWRLTQSLPSINGSELQWDRRQSTSIPGLRRAAALATEPQPFRWGDISVAQSPYGLFNRDFVTKLTATGAFSAPSDVVHLTLTVEGTGFIRFWIGKKGQGIERFAEVVLSASAPTVAIDRLITVAGAEEFEVTVEQFGNSSVRVTQMTLQPVVSSEDIAETMAISIE